MVCSSTRLVAITKAMLSAILGLQRAALTGQGLRVPFSGEGPELLLGLPA